MTDLNSLVPSDSGLDLLFATGINDKGQIIGSAYDRGRPCGFLLTPSTASSIINIHAESANTSAVITWNTNVPANSKVEYGPTTAYGQSALLSAMVTNHLVNLGSLKANTVYHYRVSSTNSQGDTQVSGDMTFVTAATNSGGNGYFAYTIHRQTNGTFEVGVTYTYVEYPNTFQYPLFTLTLLAAGLGAASKPSSPGLPMSLFPLLPGASDTFSLRFPASAGSSGSTVRLSIQLDYTDRFGFHYPVSGSFRVQLP